MDQAWANIDARAASGLLRLKFRITHCDRTYPHCKYMAASGFITGLAVHLLNVRCDVKIDAEYRVFKNGRALFWPPSYL